MMVCTMHVKVRSQLCGVVFFFILPTEPFLQSSHHFLLGCCIELRLIHIISFLLHHVFKESVSKHWEHQSSNIGMSGNTVQPGAPRPFHNERVWWHLTWLQKTCREQAVPETRPSLLLALIPFPQGPSTPADIWVLWLNQGTWSQEAWSIWSFIAEHLLSYQCNEVPRLQATRECDSTKWPDGMWAHQPPQNPGSSRSRLTLHSL